MKITKFLTLLTIIIQIIPNNIISQEIKKDNSFVSLYKIIDSHNHDSPKYRSSISMWNKYNISKIILFGSISEPDAVRTDQLSWNAYKQYPTRFIPFFASIDIHDKNCIQVAQKYLEEGYFGIGEVVATSSFSPITSKLKWKGIDPMDGYFPQIYDLCAEYKVPILLHIDPPNGYPLDKLKEALGKKPNTIFIFGHANAYNSPNSIGQLLEMYNNVFIDFYAGFTEFDSHSTNTLDDFIPLIKKYNTRFIVSSDSGSGITYDQAYNAIYILMSKLDEVTAKRVGYENIESIIEKEPITKTQINNIEKIEKNLKIDIDYSIMNKRQANEYIFKNN